MIAKKAANIPKNRFENICSCNEFLPIIYTITYTCLCIIIVSILYTIVDDHSCVELPHIDGEEGSDYINATWIDVSASLLYIYI